MVAYACNTSPHFKAGDFEFETSWGNIEDL